MRLLRAYSFENVVHYGRIGDREVKDRVLVRDPPRVGVHHFDEFLKVAL